MINRFRASPLFSVATLVALFLSTFFGTLPALADVAVAAAGSEGTAGYLSGIFQQIWLILVAILVLSILIFVHELGHFLLAKTFGVGVIEFAIGFGRKIWSKKYGDTYYSWRLIPLGGFVRMVGDDPRAMQPTSVQSSSGQSDGADAESLTTVRSVPEGDRPETAAGQDPEMEAHVAALTKRQDLWLLKKGYWAKFWIVFAGPLFNLIFALLISIGAAWIYGARVPLDQPVIGYADPNDQAGKAGLQGGDRVVAVNGTIMESWEQLATTIRNGDGSPVLLKITREGTEQEISVLPTEFPAELLAVQGLPTDKKVYKIGIEPSSTTISLGFTAGITEGFWRTVRVTQLQVMGLVAMFTGDVSPKHISGPIGIFSIASSKASRGVEYLIGFMVFLSIALAIMNLLPIPILDGGHLVFFTIEALRGKPLPLKTQEVASQFGMIVLLLLMVVAFSNDIFNLIQRWTTN